MSERMLVVTETEQPNGHCQRVFKTIKTDQPVAQVVGHEYVFNTSYYIVLIGPDCPRQRIVCAAMKSEKYGTIIASPRHCDSVATAQMRNAVAAHLNYAPVEAVGNVFKDWKHGFIDQFGTFFDRQQAWKLAEKRGQIIRRVGGDITNDGTLYSENLY